jgi:hypothetical protein
MLKVEAISLVVDGEVAIEDIRSLDWRLMAKATRKAAPSQFNIDEKIISLHLEGDSDHRGLLMKLSLSKAIISEMKETSHDFVLHQCEVFQLIISPYIKAAMASLPTHSLVSAKQEQLPRTIVKLVTQRKYGHIYNFFMRLKELQVSKVPIFTRLLSYQNIVRKYYDAWSIEEQVGYGEEAKREHLTRLNAL